MKNNFNQINNKNIQKTRAFEIFIVSLQKIDCIFLADLDTLL